MTVTLRPEAEADIEDAARWYEERRKGLGDEFLDEVIHTLGSVEENPDLYARVHDEVRQAVTHRFPFAVLYIVDDDHAVVVAVMHARRNPAEWKSRT